MGNYCIPFLRSLSGYHGSHMTPQQYSKHKKDRRVFRSKLAEELAKHKEDRNRKAEFGRRILNDDSPIDSPHASHLGIRPSLTNGSVESSPNTRRKQVHFSDLAATDEHHVEAEIYGEPYLPAGAANAKRPSRGRCATGEDNSDRVDNVSYTHI